MRQLISTNAFLITLRSIIASSALSASTILTSGAQISEPEPSVRPNIVLILVDDAAFMDFGGFGGEARTPNINALADDGVRFTNYRTSPLCSPSRAMLLTGLDNHLTGMGTIPEVVTDEQLGQDGYLMQLAPGVETIADRLREAGYETFMTGKWHLGSKSGDLPVDHGFDRSFALDASGADNWEEKPYMPYYSEAPWYEDGARAHLPDDFYSSRFIVEKMIEYLDARESDSDPFFSYLAFQAIHIPIQAPRELTDSYEGVYEQGWDALQKQRWEQAKALGLIDADAPLAAMPAGLRIWDELSEEDKQMARRSMQVNAAMLEAMDQQIGRLVSHLKDTGDFDNTVFVITSDNGPEFNDPVHQKYMDMWMATHGYDHKVETLGEKGSLAYIGAEWAAAAASPGALFKFFTSEGGIRVPMIMSGPGIEHRGHSAAFSFVADVTPTLLELAGAAPADGDSFTGRSLMPVLSADEDRVYQDGEAVGLEVSGNAALFMDDHKLLKVTAPYGDGAWRLFNVRLDPGETTDLSDEAPELKARMLAEYEAFAERVGVVDPPPGFDVMEQVRKSAIRKQLHHYAGLLSGVGLILILLIGFGLWTAIRMFRQKR